MRSISREGVAHVMRQFLKAHMSEEATPLRPTEAKEVRDDGGKKAGQRRRKRRAADAICEEELLEAFSK